MNRDGSRTIVHCRDCGQAALEYDDDPAPGLCPGCLEQRLLDAAARMAGMSAPEAISALVGSGLTPKAAAQFIDHLRRMQRIDAWPADKEQQ
jgi:hypothetical protein